MVDEEAAKSNHSCEPGAVDRDAPKKDAFHIQLTSVAERFFGNGRLCAALLETRISPPVLHRLTHTYGKAPKESAIAPSKHFAAVHHLME